MSVIRGSLRPLRPPQPLLIVAQQWPSWLVVAQAFDLPIAGAYFPPTLHRYFKPKRQFPWYAIVPVLAVVDTVKNKMYEPYPPLSLH